MPKLSPTEYSRARVRARLLARGVTIRALADAAQVDESMASKVVRGRRSPTSPAGLRVVQAAESLTGLTWGQLAAPVRSRRLAA